MIYEDIPWKLHKFCSNADVLYYLKLCYIHFIIKLLFSHKKKQKILIDRHIKY